MLYFIDKKIITSIPTKIKEKAIQILNNELDDKEWSRGFRDTKTRIQRAEQIYKEINILKTIPIQTFPFEERVKTVLKANKKINL